MVLRTFSNVQKSPPRVIIGYIYIESFQIIVQNANLEE